MTKTFTILHLLFSITLFAQETIKVHTDSSVIETKHFKNLNSIREFNELKNTDRIYFKEYYYDTKSLREIGVFENGYRVGIWEYYTKAGELEKKIDYNTNIKKLYTKTSEPYDSLFNSIKQIADSILTAKYGYYFFTNSVIQNTNRSFYFGSGTPGSWFETPDFRPNKFSLRYDVKLGEGSRLWFFELTLDSLGRLTNDLESFSNLKQQFLITKEKATSLSLQKGLTILEQPFQYRLVSSDGNLLLMIIGKPLKKSSSGNTVTEEFNFIILDPWTGSLVEKGVSENLITID